ncbi:MAG: hypothetical protein ACUVQY_08260 [Thermoproteota archaeon]
MVKKKAVLIARERIDILLKQALDTASIDAGQAESYARLAWRIAEKFNLREKTILRRYFRCSKCKDFFILGRTCKIRVLKKRGIGITCMKCGNVKVIPVFNKKEIKGRRIGYMG